MADNNELRVDLAGNPKLAAHFSGKNIGDTCELTVEGTVKSLDPNNEAVIAIDKVTYEDYGPESEKGESEAYPSEEEPMKIEINPAGPAPAPVGAP